MLRTFLYISLSSLHVKMPNSTYYGGLKQAIENFLSLSDLGQSLGIDLFTDTVAILN